MNVRVVPRKWFLERAGTDAEKAVFDTLNVVSIITPAHPGTGFEEEDVPFSIQYRDLPTVLVLKFHDAETKADDDVVLMSEADADRVYRFVEETKGNGRDYLVHCTAGKSRSQAVGYVLNEWLNGNGVHEDEYEEYERLYGGTRTMNSLVKRLLMNRFFGGMAQ